MARKVLTGVLCLAVGMGLLEATATPSLAQTEPPAPTAQELETGPNRQGFTFELAAGYGLQLFLPVYGDVAEADSGWSVLNLGIGGFINPTVALLFRTMGTITVVELSSGNDQTTIMVVAGPTAQVWPLDVLRFEAGLGFAAVSRHTTREVDFAPLNEDEVAFGLLLGGAWAFWQSSNHSLSLGFEYAPGFFDNGTVQNISFVFGWQLL